MNNDASLKDLLLKFSFLYTGNSRLAKEITERFINENPTYTHFSKIEIVQRLVKTCRAEYKTTAHLKQAIANTVTFYQIKKSSLISKLLSFSIVRREIILLNYVADIPIKTISEMVNMQEAKVRTSLKKTELELIPYFPNDDLLVKEHLKIAVDELEIVEEERILAVDYVKQLSVFKWFSLTSLIVVILLLAGAFFYMSNVQKNEQTLLVTSSNHLEEKNSRTKESTESTSKLIENDNQAESPLSMHIPDRLMFQIAEYETFYNATFNSSKQTKYSVALRMLEMYYVRKFMYEHNIVLSNERAEYLMELSNISFDTKIQDETEAFMINKILTEFNISKEDYIQNYLYPVNEYNELTKIMHEKEMSLFDSVGNIYEMDEIPKKFFESVGLMKEEFEEIGNLLMVESWDVVEENPENLPFNIVGTTLKISARDGKLFIDNPVQFNIDSTIYVDFYHKRIVNDLGLLLTRNTFKPITNYLENVEFDFEQENVLAVELLELLRVLERSVEWELQD